eukprot:1515001-Pleurochrysis_carterae.AAC.1
MICESRHSRLAVWATGKSTASVHDHQLESTATQPTEATTAAGVFLSPYAAKLPLHVGKECMITSQARHELTHLEFEQRCMHAAHGRLRVTRKEGETSEGKRQEAWRVKNEKKGEVD